jgi:hypothetical protein
VPEADVGEGVADGEGEGDGLASLSRSFRIFMIALTGGGASRDDGELEQPAKIAVTSTSEAVCKRFKVLRFFMGMV